MLLITLELLFEVATALTQRCENLVALKSHQLMCSQEDGCVGRILRFVNSFKILAKRMRKDTASMGNFLGQFPQAAEAVAKAIPLKQM